MFSFETATRLARLQSRLWAALAEALREDSHRKSDDGMVIVTFKLPPAFDWGDAPAWEVAIVSYVLCDDGRSQTFSGRSIEEALSKAEDYAGRICMMHEMAGFERSLGGGDHE